MEGQEDPSSRTCVFCKKKSSFSTSWNHSAKIELGGFSTGNSEFILRVGKENFGAEELRLSVGIHLAPLVTGPPLSSFQANHAGGGI